MSEDDQLLRTALHDMHLAAGAEMGNVAGWEMPRSYRGVLDECAEVRRRAGAFDVSHLGRIRLRGGGALDALEYLCTADVARQEDDTALYSLLLNDSGGIIDQCLVVRTARFWVLTCSPGNRPKVLEHIRAHADRFDFKVDDQTQITSQVLVAGPAAAELLDAVLPMRVSDLPAGSAKTGSLLIARYIALRTGYTGQWGLEVMIPNMVAARAWRFITQKAGASAIQSAGHGARDVLRIEAGLCRYGRELNETIDPITAGLAFAVDFEKDFLGAGAVHAAGVKARLRRRVGLVLAPEGKPGETEIPPQGSLVCRSGGCEVGAITSGTFSPTLAKTIAMAYVAPEAAAEGTELLVVTPAASRPAQVVGLPFYRGSCR